MSSDQYRVLWVEHRDKVNEETGESRLELNFLIPNVEVNSGKRLQPFYAAADLDRVECFKQITNHDYALHDPDDPMNRQATKVAKSLPASTKELKTALEVEIALAIGEGMISDRPSLVQWLGDIGLEVTRQTPKAISIKNPNPDGTRPIKLTGAIYEQDFRHTGESTELTAAASASYRAAATERYRASCERYDKMLAAKGEYHQQRYRPQQQRDPDSPERSNSSTIAADRPNYSKGQEATAAGHDNTIARATGTDHTATSELSQIERLEPRNSPSGKGKENPYHVEYSLDFNSVYRSYLLYLSDIRYQKQEQRDAGKNSTITADRSSYTTENSGIQYSGGSTVQGERGQVDDFEAQLLQIIEQQQEQLKEQQKQQEQALQFIQAQNRTIDELENYNRRLVQSCTQLKEKDSEQMQIINRLKNPELSENLLQQVENTLRQQLEERLMLLIGRLNIEQQIAKALPELAQSEIEKQLEPLTKQVIEKMSSVEQYQQKLAALVQTLSMKL